MKLPRKAQAEGVGAGAHPHAGEGYGMLPADGGQLPIPQVKGIGGPQMQQPIVGRKRLYIAVPLVVCALIITGNRARRLAGGGVRVCVKGVHHLLCREGTGAGGADYLPRRQGGLHRKASALRHVHTL